jgi:mannosyltransferase OCH1-like enzyme
MNILLYCILILILILFINLIRISFLNENFNNININNIIHQVWFDDVNKPIWMDTWKKNYIDKYSNFSYKYWSLNDIKWNNIIKEKFDKTEDKDEKLKLARLNILYVNGGICIDANSIWNNNKNLMDIINKSTDDFLIGSDIYIHKVFASSKENKNIILYINNELDNNKYKVNTLEYVLPLYNIYCFWTGDNNISENRLNCVKQLKENSKCYISLIMKNDLPDYISSNHPLHESFQYLSFTHKSDYLRTYFMNHYGGGYSDIKKTTGPWINAFDELFLSDYWFNGYKEVQGGVACGPGERWTELIGNGAYISKPNTPFTNEWYNAMIAKLDTKLDTLKKYPASYPQDGDGSIKTNYPIYWSEILGSIFHCVIYKYINKILRTLPPSIFNNYR